MINLAKPPFKGWSFYQEDPQKLLARISELENTVESLRKDNAALRQQLQSATTRQPASPAPEIGGELTPRANSFMSSVSSPTGLSYTSVRPANATIPAVDTMGVVDPADRQTESRARSAEADGR